MRIVKCLARHIRAQCWHEQLYKATLRKMQPAGVVAWYMYLQFMRIYSTVVSHIVHRVFDMSNIPTIIIGI